MSTLDDPAVLADFGINNAKEQMPKFVQRDERKITNKVKQRQRTRRGWIHCVTALKRLFMVFKPFLQRYT